MYKIKDLVKDKTATFYKYRHNVLYYWIEHDDKMLFFPVYLEDLGDATIKCYEKAITLMRYIRKAIEDGTLVESI